MSLQFISEGGARGEEVEEALAADRASVADKMNSKEVGAAVGAAAAAAAAFSSDDVKKELKRKQLC